MDFKKFKRDIPSHPLGIKPLGNALFDCKRNIRSSGLGSFAILTDELIIEFLKTVTDCDLIKLCQLSKSFYILTSTEELWRDKFKETFTLLPCFRENWKTTFINLKYKRKDDQTISFDPTSISINDYYSDYLYSSWRCASVPLQDLISPRDNIQRFTEMTIQDFELKQSKTPFILCRLVETWPCYTKWTMDYFVEKYGSQVLKAEALDVTFDSYASYALQCNEESPLYLFDKHFATRSSDLGQDYIVPDIFSRDLFALLGDKRPDFQWLICGPKRSGSTFHLDPNGTSAWNALIKGRKKWILYPPNHLPPGVFPSSDGSEVTSPVSLIEWYLSYYSQIQSDPYSIECICDEGEIVFIPSGWWHCVLNLTDTIAITQNFCSPHNLYKVLNFLREKSDQISGIQDDVSGHTLFDEFIELLKEHDPQLVESEWQKKILRKKNPIHSIWNTCTSVNSEFKFEF